MNEQANLLAFVRWNSLTIGVCLLSGCIALSGMPDLNTPDGRVYAAQCAKCHGLPEPRFRTITEWKPIVVGMADKIRQKGLPPLTIPERAAILRFLERHANPEKVSKL